MPIIGLTTNVQPAFPSLGTLRKGDVKEANRPGADLRDRFRFISERREVQEAFEKAFGTDKPTVLHVYLPHATVAANWDPWQEEWVQGSLVHRCDGQTMVRWQAKDGDYSDEPRPCPYAADPSLRTKDRPGCKAVGRLSLLIPELMLAGFVGYVTLTTTGLNDIPGITASLTDAAQKANGHGLQGIEWILWRQEVKVSTPGADGRRVRRPKWLVRIAPTAEWVKHQLRTATAAQLGQLPAPATARVIDPATGAIGAPEEDDDAEAEDVAEGEYTKDEPESEPEAPPQPERRAWPPADQNAWVAELRRRAVSQHEAARLLNLEPGKGWSSLGSKDELLAALDAAIKREAEAEQKTLDMKGA